MVWTIIILIALVAGIIILGAYTPVKIQTREQFLQALAKFLEGDLRPMEAEPDGACVNFPFEGQDFSYEDVPEHGFTEKAYKGYLKAQTPAKLTMTFSEKPRSSPLKTSVVIASNIRIGPAQPEAERVRVPPKLKDFSIHTNDPRLVNELLEDAKVVSILQGFKNIDARGCPSMSLKILNGLLILEFSPLIDKKPNRPSLVHDIHAVDECLTRLLAIIKRLKKLSA